MSEIINWLRKPQRYWLWVDIGQNQFEGPIIYIRVLLSQKAADDFVNWEIEQFSMTKGYEMVKVKTDLGELTDSFLHKFLFDDRDIKDQIVNFQRYRGKTGGRYVTTAYLFEVNV